ncbi:hypothetical protein [Nocardia farcinica]|nr:hypothetical protein [Nocardia farcinica]
MLCDRFETTHPFDSPGPRQLSTSMKETPLTIPTPPVKAGPP